MEIKLCKIPMIRDTEQEPNSPPTSAEEAQSSLAFGHFTKKVLFFSECNYL
ncbi:hypothetical protein U063_0690 [Helicobacter pylori BM012A]|uniref:Uncharacterized protein n=1 Tax=Helicobacter pylori BM012S TaxID=1407463 RepID=V5NLX9_HELPX|nr:hypothetical protein U063_0690 [Helicobacter pylori BM012A]AHA89615.1 hypothetical protein U064_0692 [Helicobacter pylori BM012S]